MNRRVFLTGLTGAAATIVATRPLGIVRDFRMNAIGPESINRTPIEATVIDHSWSSVTVSLQSNEDIERFRLVAYRRWYPNGKGFDLAESDVVTLDPGVKQSVEIPFETAHQNGSSDRWGYVIFHRKATEFLSESYLCESDPLRTSYRNEPRIRPASLVYELNEATRPDFVRADSPGRFDLTYRWKDTSGREWSLEHSVAKSAYEDAYDRRRGYIETYEESLRNPYAQRLGEVIGSARRMDVGRSKYDADRGPIDPSGMGPVRDRERSESERLELATGLVQGLRYVRDRNSHGSYDYHRTVEETLVHGFGDCKDKTYLLSGMLAQPPFSYATALVFKPSHVLVGVERDDLPSAYHESPTIEGSEERYVAIETTFPRPIGDHGASPVVAIYDKNGWSHVNYAALEETVARQTERFYQYFTGQSWD